MNEWLDNFQMMGIKLNEGEKNLMRMAMRKERERIIKLLEKQLIPNAASGSDAEAFGWREGMRYAVELIKGENK